MKTSNSLLVLLSTLSCMLAASCGGDLEPPDPYSPTELEPISAEPENGSEGSEIIEINDPNGLFAEEDPSDDVDELEDEHFYTSWDDGTGDSEMVAQNRSAGPHLVHVFFHILDPHTDTNEVTRHRINEQMKRLKMAFAPTGMFSPYAISFKLEEIIRYKNDLWHSNILDPRILPEVAHQSLTQRLMHLTELLRQNVRQGRIGERAVTPNFGQRRDYIRHDHGGQGGVEKYLRRKGSWQNGVSSPFALHVYVADLRSCDARSDRMISNEYEQYEAPGRNDYGPERRKRCVGNIIPWVSLPADGGIPQLQMWGASGVFLNTSLLFGAHESFAYRFGDASYRKPIQLYGHGDMLIQAVGRWFGIKNASGLSCDKDNDGFCATPRQLATPQRCIDTLYRRWKAVYERNNESGGIFGRHFGRRQCNRNICGPRDRDTCPNSRGKDSINNFMSQAPDFCRRSFRPEQRRYMHVRLYSGFRVPPPICIRAGG